MNPWDILGTVVGWALVAIVLVVSLATIVALVDNAVAKAKSRRNQADLRASIHRIQRKNDG